MFVSCAENSTVSVQVSTGTYGIFTTNKDHTSVSCVESVFLEFLPYSCTPQPIAVNVDSNVKYAKERELFLNSFKFLHNNFTEFSFEFVSDSKPRIVLTYIGKYMEMGRSWCAIFAVRHSPILPLNLLICENTGIFNVQFVPSVSYVRSPWEFTKRVTSTRRCIHVTSVVKHSDEFVTWTNTN